MLKRAILLSTLVLNMACSGSDDKDSELAGTVSLAGVVEGLTGEISIYVNGNLETITNNGQFTSSTRIEENATYSVTVNSSSDNLDCLITNGSGTAIANISDVTIVCNGLAENFKAYNLNALAFQEEEPSVLTFAFHLIDRFTGTAVDSIDKSNITEYLNVLENNSVISPRESFLEVDKLSNYNAEYKTVFVIDVSSSLFNNELTSIKNAIKNVISDPVTQESKLLPNQSITILTFDSEVDVVIENSQDPEAIIEMLDAVTIGGNSTNLYGAIKQGAEVWQNEISLELLSYGSLILFTDGVHNSDSSSTSAALNAAKGKDLYFIAIGDEADTTTLSEFTATDNIYQLENFDELDGLLQSTFAKIKTYEDGLYVMSYATPKRSGTHTLTVEAIDDYPCTMAVTPSEEAQLENGSSLDNCNDSFSDDFSAAGFTDIEPILTLTGARTTLVPEMLWQAKLRWSRETPIFNWQIKACRGGLEFNLSEDNAAVTFTRTDPDFAIGYVSLTEGITGVTTDSYLIMASKQSTINNKFLFSKDTLEDICDN